jgi:pyruvate/2-oxoglutarate dehydrogenase complex dihydrolipoamide dehydrogenase (E3) component
MAQPERVGILVLGSGEAGKYLAWHLAHAGHQTAAVGRQRVGGSRPNINCPPSKMYRCIGRSGKIWAKTSRTS